MSSVTAAPDKVRHKTFQYRTAVNWTGGRSGRLVAEGRPALDVSSPPEFKGEAGRWTPEDLFVAAVDLCTMTTFLFFAERRKLTLLGYESRAEGVLEFVDGGYRFTRVVLRPRLTLADGADESAAAEALGEAHEACLIGRSVSAEVRIEPEFARPDA
jgi:organic hydroperoxide reductase OsmC/OhrA